MAPPVTIPLQEGVDLLLHKSRNSRHVESATDYPTMYTPPSEDLYDYMPPHASDCPEIPEPGVQYPNHAYRHLSPARDQILRQQMTYTSSSSPSSPILAQYRPAKSPTRRSAFVPPAHSVQSVPYIQSVQAKESPIWSGGAPRSPRVSPHSQTNHGSQSPIAPSPVEWTPARAMGGPMESNLECVLNASVHSISKQHIARHCHVSTQDNPSFNRQATVSPRRVSQGGGVQSLHVAKSAGPATSPGPGSPHAFMWDMPISEASQTSSVRYAVTRPSEFLDSQAPPVGLTPSHKHADAKVPEMMTAPADVAESDTSSRPGTPDPPSHPKWKSELAARCPTIRMSPRHHLGPRETAHSPRPTAGCVMSATRPDGDSLEGQVAVRSPTIRARSPHSPHRLTSAGGCMMSLTESADFSSPARMPTISPRSPHSAIGQLPAHHASISPRNVDRSPCRADVSRQGTVASPRHADVSPNRVSTSQVARPQIFESLGIGGRADAAEVEASQQKPVFFHETSLSGWSSDAESTNSDAFAHRGVLFQDSSLSGWGSGGDTFANLESLHASSEEENEEEWKGRKGERSGEKGVGKGRKEGGEKGALDKELKLKGFVSTLKIPKVEGGLRLSLVAEDGDTPLSLAAVTPYKDDLARECPYKTSPTACPGDALDPPLILTTPPSRQESVEESVARRGLTVTYGGERSKASSKKKGSPHACVSPQARNRARACFSLEDVRKDKGQSERGNAPPVKLFGITSPSTPVTLSKEMQQFGSEQMCPLGGEGREEGSVRERRTKGRSGSLYRKLKTVGKDSFEVSIPKQGVGDLKVRRKASFDASRIAMDGLSFPSSPSTYLGSPGGSSANMSPLRGCLKSPMSMSQTDSPRKKQVQFSPTVGVRKYHRKCEGLRSGSSVGSNL